MPAKKRGSKSFDIDLIKKASRLLKGETLSSDDLQKYRLHERTQKSYKRLKIDVNARNKQWSIDLAELNYLARYNYGYKYWLVSIDVYSRYVFLKLLKNKSSNNVGKKFEEILHHSGEIPEKIQSDEGTEFQKIRKELSKKYNFKLFHTFNREIKASHVERVIQTLKTMVRRVISVTNNFNYSKYIHVVVQRYNDSPHKALFNNSPYDIYFDRKKIPIEKRLLKIFKNPSIIHSFLKKGQKVRIARAKNSVFEKSSLQRWRGEIFKISKVFVTDPITYEITDLNNEVIKGKFYREELQVV